VFFRNQPDVQVGLEVPANDSVVNPVKNALNIDGKWRIREIIAESQFLSKGRRVVVPRAPKDGESR